MCQLQITLVRVSVVLFPSQLLFVLNSGGSMPPDWLKFLGETKKQVGARLWFCKLSEYCRFHPYLWAGKCFQKWAEHWPDLCVALKFLAFPAVLTGLWGEVEFSNPDVSWSLEGDWCTAGFKRAKCALNIEMLYRLAMLYSQQRLLADLLYASLTVQFMWETGRTLPLSDVAFHWDCHTSWYPNHSKYLLLGNWKKLGHHLAVEITDRENIELPQYFHKPKWIFSLEIFHIFRFENKRDYVCFMI